jgi:hypothetical protein
MNYENPQSEIDYRAIGEAYSYIPLPMDKPVDLTIDWNTGTEERRDRQYAEMIDFFTKLKATPDDKDLWKSITRTSPAILTDKDNITSGTETWIHSHSKVLYLRIFHMHRGGIGQFMAANHEGSNTWDLHDRQVSEKYRGKGAAAEMLQETENCVQAYADAHGKDQDIFVDASQLSVLNFFLKNGYEIVYDDKERFAETMSKLETGDLDFVLSGCQTGSGFQKDWYVFEHDKYDEVESQMHGLQPPSRNHLYQTKSVRFMLRKKVKANKKAVENQVDGVRGQIGI